MTSSAASGGPTYEYTRDEWRVHDVAGGEHAVTEVRLLETPTGWESRMTTLTAFHEDGTYDVNTDDSADGTSLTIRFTLADLRSLGEGQVWAAPPVGYGDPRAMSRKDFDKRARDVC